MVDAFFRSLRGINVAIIVEHTKRFILLENQCPLGGRRRRGLDVVFRFRREDLTMGQAHRISKVTVMKLLSTLKDLILMDGGAISFQPFAAPRPARLKSSTKCRYSW